MLIQVTGKSQNPHVDGDVVKPQKPAQPIKVNRLPEDVTESAQHVADVSRSNQLNDLSLAGMVANLLPHSAKLRSAGWEGRVRDPAKLAGGQGPLIEAVMGALEDTEDPYARGTYQRLKELLPPPGSNSDLKVAIPSIPSPAETDMRTTYYQQFPANPRPSSQLVHVFWVINRDHRALSQPERRNVVYPGERAGLIAKAPKDEKGVRLNLRGETSRCGYVLTEEGARYYKGNVEKILPDDFVSNEPLPRTRRTSRTTEPNEAQSLDDIKNNASA
jgi:hypothetical protein